MTRGEAAALAPMPAPRLSADDFIRVAHLLEEVAGIHLQPGKEELVKSRLARRLRSTGQGSYQEYLDFVTGRDGGEELVHLVDALTTNKTSFFREARHFDFLVDELVPKWKAARLDEVRIWSAGCSSGEEPYTLSMVLHDQSPPPVRILASDISTQILARAREGVYTDAQVADVPRPLLSTHFSRKSDPPRFGGADGGGSSWEVRPATRSRVAFARLNLMGPWPMRRPFHLILCRNVMIYFDAEVRERLLARFLSALVPGGILMVGHSESLTSTRHGFEYLQPAVYRKPESGT